MARILGHLGDNFDAESLTAADVEGLAKSVKLDVQKVEKLKQAWGEPERPNWAVELVAQALSGFMFVAGIWKVPTVAEAAQAESAAGAKRVEVLRASEYAAAMKNAAEQGELAKRFKADPDKFRAERLAERNRILAKQAGPIRRETVVSDQDTPESRSGAPETALPGPGGEKTAAESPADPGTPPDVASNIDKGPDIPVLMDGRQVGVASPIAKQADGTVLADFKLAEKLPADELRRGYTPEELAELQRMEREEEIAGGDSPG